MKEKTNLATQEEDKNIKNLNSYQHNQLFGLHRFLIVFITMSLGSLCCFLGYLVYDQNKSDLVYFATPGGTFSEEKHLPNNSIREDFELENFAASFIRDAFCHSENNYRENIERALVVMTNESGIELKKKFSDDNILKLYKEFNGFTTVAVGKVNINTSSYPYTVDVHYVNQLKFLSSEKKTVNRTYKQGIRLIVSQIARCKENPYGLVIQQFNFIRHEDN